MQIYVVQPGDSVWSIANNFGVSQASIITANRLDEIPNLVIGQALVIPSTETAYRVQPGDSLWSIGRRFGVPPESIARFNGISVSTPINAGMILRIPALAKNYGYIEVNAFIEPSTTQAETQIINEVGRYLTYLSPFSYQVKADGSLTPINDTNILSVARTYRDAPLMVITNFSGPTFSTELAHTILSSPQVQQNVINNVLTTMQNKGYYGLVIDFERLPEDAGELYNSFLRKIVGVLHQSNYFVGTALAPKTSGIQTGAWYTAHDYPAHGQIMDFVILMTYEWGWSGGPPLAVAPINQVRTVLNYAVSVIPRNKIFMGMPLYGYNWKLPYVEGGPFAPRVSPQQAIQLAAKYGANIQYDEQAQSPFFNYTDENGAEHIVWFEDARSAQAKYLLENEFGLRGVSFWELGSEFPQTWEVLDNMFNIVKVV